MKEVSTQELKKILNSQLTFEIKKYNEIQNKNQYLKDLVNYVFIKQRINPNKICLNELAEAIKQLGFELRIQQLHQIYIYSTFQIRSNKTITAKERLISLVNQDRRKINIDLVVEWFINNLANCRIKNPIKVPKTSNRIKSETFSPNTNTFKLPNVNKKQSKTKLQCELQILINIFQQMEKLRQGSGLIPINFQQNESSLVEIPFIHIPYDPQLYDLNQNISRLRLKAELQLKKIIQLAKQQPDIRKKLQIAIQKFQKNRIEANQKIGRTGAINAQKRLAVQRQKQLNKHKSLRFDYDEDLIKAARVYNLLSIPQPKIKPVY